MRKGRSLRDSNKDRESSPIKHESSDHSEKATMAYVECPEQDMGVVKEKNANNMLELCLCKSGESIASVCRRCQKLICPSCESARHKYHDTGDIASVASELKSKIQTKATAQGTDKRLILMRQEKQTGDDMIEELSTLEMNEIDQIDQHLETLHKTIDKIGNRLKCQVNELITKETHTLKKTQTEMERVDRSITTLCDRATEFIQSADDVDTIKKGYHLIADLDESMELNVPTILNKVEITARFVRGTVEEDLLVPMCGQVSQNSETGKGAVFEIQETVSQDYETEKGEVVETPETASKKKTPKHLRTFKIPNSNDDVHLCLIGESCLIYSDQREELMLVNVNGDMERSIHVGKTGNGDMTSSFHGAVYMSFGKLVHMMSPDWVISKPFKSLRHEPSGLAFDPTTNAVLACSKGDVFSMKGRGIRKIQIYNTGNALDIAVNAEGDICVVGDNEANLYDRDHDPVAMCRVNATSVSCNSENNFVIADGYKNKVHIINQNGKNLLAYSTKKDCRENIISASMSKSGRLWVGFKNGVVCVYDMV